MRIIFAAVAIILIGNNSAYAYRCSVNFGYFNEAHDRLILYLSKDINDVKELLELSTDLHDPELSKIDVIHRHQMRFSSSNKHGELSRALDDLLHTMDAIEHQCQMNMR